MSYSENPVTALAWLEAFYAQSCDGDWEHDYGVEIGTLDNPGWSVRVNLQGTSLEGRSFEKRVTERSDTDWMHCWFEAGTWNARGGSRNLQEMLQVLQEWAQRP